MLIADDRDLRLKHLDLVQLQPRQDAAHRRTAQTRDLRDPHTGPAFPPQLLDAFDEFLRGAAR